MSRKQVRKREQAKLDQMQKTIDKLVRANPNATTRELFDMWCKDGRHFSVFGHLVRWSPPRAKRATVADRCRCHKPAAIKDNVLKHPKRDLMVEAKFERQLAGAPTRRL